MCLPTLPAPRPQMPDKRWTLTELIDRALDRDGEVASGHWKVESAAARRAAKLRPLKSSPACASTAKAA